MDHLSIGDNSVNQSAPLTPAFPLRGLLALLGGQSLDGEFDVLRDRWQKASFVSGDRVPCHAEFRGEFSLCETEVEPSEIPKCPTRQVASGYLREHGGAIRLCNLSVGTMRDGADLLPALGGR